MFAKGKINHLLLTATAFKDEFTVIIIYHFYREIFVSVGLDALHASAFLLLGHLDRLPIGLL